MPASCLLVIRRSRALAMKSSAAIASFFGRRLKLGVAFLPLLFSLRLRERRLACALLHGPVQPLLSLSLSLDLLPLRLGNQVVHLVVAQELPRGLHPLALNSLLQLPPRSHQPSCVLLGFHPNRRIWVRGRFSSAVRRKAEHRRAMKPVLSLRVTRSSKRSEAWQFRKDDV
jgi:hypothetical protein